MKRLLITNTKDKSDYINLMVYYFEGYFKITDKQFDRMVKQFKGNGYSFEIDFELVNCKYVGKSIDGLHRFDIL